MMDSFELDHAKEILIASFSWARESLIQYGHCGSIEWKYDNGPDPEAGGINHKYKEESMLLSSRVFGLMSKSVPNQHKLLKEHFTTRKPEGVISRRLGFHNARYEAELDRALLSFYNQLKRHCGIDKFRRLFLV